MSRILILIMLVLVLQVRTDQNSLARETGPRPYTQTGHPARQELSSFSPYEIKRYVNSNGHANLNPIWHYYGIKPEPFARFGESYVNYQAEIFPGDLDADPFRDVILRIWYADAYRYLIFKGQSASDEEHNGGKYLGFVDVEYQQYGPPEHRVVAAGKQAWLIMKELWGRGTGVVRYGETWYEIKEDEKKLKPVLSYPVEGREIPCLGMLGRRFGSKIIKQGIVNGNYAVEVEFSVSHFVSDCSGGSGEDRSLPLFSKKQKASYIWNSRAGKFALDASESQLSEGEIEAVYNFDSLDNERFLEYNFEELKTLAGQGGEGQRKWLRQFLIDLPSSERKKALSAVVK